MCHQQHQQHPLKIPVQLLSRPMAKARPELLPLPLPLVATRRHPSSAAGSAGCYR